MPYLRHGGRSYGQKEIKPNYRKTILRPPDPDHSQSSVLNSLSSPGSRRAYGFAIDQFTAWYCSEPRLALNRAVVLRLRLHFGKPRLGCLDNQSETRGIRRLAYEAADSGLLSPELAAGIRRVKGVKQLGSRSGNWLNLEQASLLLANSNGDSLRNERDLAMIAILLGCRLRRAELATLNIEDIQIRQRHWAIVDLIGKGGYIRTVLGRYPPSAGKSNILVLGRDAVRGRPDTVPCAQAGRDP